jgi:hypothetical protein
MTTPPSRVPSPDDASYSGNVCRNDGWSHDRSRDWEADGTHSLQFIRFRADCDEIQLMAYLILRALRGSTFFMTVWFWSSASLLQQGTGIQRTNIHIVPYRTIISWLLTEEQEQKLAQLLLLFFSRVSPRLSGFDRKLLPRTLQPLYYWLPLGGTSTTNFACVVCLSQHESGFQQGRVDLGRCCHVPHSHDAQRYSDANRLSM